MTDFGTHLKHWRGMRRMSQLDLALEADVSTRHVSFLETGRARPSRQMVKRLGAILDLPLPDQNALTEAAGYRAPYLQRPLDDAALAPMRAALDRIVAGHAPFPAIIKDRDWRLIDLNPSAMQLFAAVGLGKGDSLLDFIAEPGAGAAAIENWAEVGAFTARRLLLEARARGGAELLEAAANTLIADPAVAAHTPQTPAPPIIETIYTAGGLRLPMFATFVHLGGAEDLGLCDLSVELMFPSGPAAEATWTAIFGAP